MRVESTIAEGVYKITPSRLEDSRGYFSETFKDSWFRENVKDIGFVQDNESLSIREGTVRGLHFQCPPYAQGKLVRCIQGAILDVVVDIRSGLPSFGKWISQELSRENGIQLWVPPGFAHGFVTLQPMTLVSYKVTEVYSPKHDMGIIWDDPDIGISWPVSSRDASISQKDRSLPKLAEIPRFF